MNSKIKEPVSGIRKALTSFSFRRDWVYLLLVGLAFIAALLLKYDMAWGPWAFSDSAAYISAARNLVAGQGLSVSTAQGGFEPLTLHQPLYPLIMSFFLLFDIHPFTTSLVIDITSFSLSVLIFGSGIYHFSHSKLLAIYCSLLFVFSPNLITNYDGAMSEPLYLFFTLSTFFCVLLYIENQKRMLLLLAAILAGLSILTRFIGVANVLFGAIVIFFFLPDPPKISLRKSISFSVFAFLPTVFWILLGIISRNPSSRLLQLPPDLFKNFQSFIQLLFETFSDWLPFQKQVELSPQTRLVIIIVTVTCISLFFLVFFFLQLKSKEKVPSKTGRLISASGIYILSYLAVFYAAFAFSSLPPDVNSRTMVPLLPFLLYIMPALLYFFTRRTRLYLLMPLSLTLATIWILSSSKVSTYDLVVTRHLNGFGYTSAYWQGSTVLKAARDLPRDIPWISNESAFLLLYLNKFPYDLTTIYPLIVSGYPVPFGEGGSNLDRIFREEGAALLLHQPQFENDLRKLMGDSAKERVEIFTDNLKIYQKSYDGSVYFYR